ncbi:MAG: amidohydrolase family protein [Syntrophales bacterium]|nr:amidohydrolase family protein [Syntrophales bacterium]
MSGKVIDGHRHIVCPEAHRRAGRLDARKATDLYPAGINRATYDVNTKMAPEWLAKQSDVSRNIADLVEAGMDIGVVQPNPLGFYYWAEGSTGADLSRIVNEYMAEAVRQYPDRLLGLATVPMQDVDRAVKEIAYAVQKLKLSGVVVGTNINGKGLDDPQFLPFFEAVEDLDIPIFIHASNPFGAERIRDYYLVNLIGFPVETAITVAQLVFGGVLDRYPRLKICLSHAGGVFPFIVGRLEHGQSVRPETAALCKHPFSHYLRNLYVDTITYRADTLRFVLEMMPKGNVFLGTDYPFDMADGDPVKSVKSAVSDPASLEAILGGNISRLMRLS